MLPTLSYSMACIARNQTSSSVVSRAFVTSSRSKSGSGKQKRNKEHAICVLFNKIYNIEMVIGEAYNMPDIQKPAHVAELIRTQRATRQYSQREVTEEDIRTILNAGRRAQSSRNLQRWYFIVVRDRERLRRLAEGGKYAEH